MMDAVSWFEYGRLGDRPDCVSPVISAYCRMINDLMQDDDRQKLVKYIPRVIGTAIPEYEAERAKILARFAMLVFLPAALDRAGLTKEASYLRSLSEIGQARRYATKLNTVAWVLKRFKGWNFIRLIRVTAVMTSAINAAWYAKFDRGYYSDMGKPGWSEFVARFKLDNVGEYAGLATDGAAVEDMLDALDAALAVGVTQRRLTADDIAHANESFARAGAYTK
jgi:hypothetical protein